MSEDSQNPKQKTIPTLYNISSSQAFAVLWALEELSLANGLKYHVKNLSRAEEFKTSSLKAIFPLGKSPLVTVEPVDGDAEPVQKETIYQIRPNTLTESMLILQFVSDSYSNGIWIPDSEDDKRRDVFFQVFAKSTLQREVDYAVAFENIAMVLPFGPRQFFGLLLMPIVGFFKKNQRLIFQVMEDELNEERKWFAGSKIGLADFNMEFAMSAAVQRDYFEGEKYPKLKDWYRRISEREAYKNAREKGGKYDLVKFT